MAFLIYVIIIIVIIGLIYFFYDKSILDFRKEIITKKDIINTDNGISEEIDHLDLQEHNKRKESKGQKQVREYLEKRFNKKFIECRPSFLKNPKTKRNLEFDCYNDELKLAIEYNGKQHYEFCSKFHKTASDFQNQVLRDNIKVNLSEKNNIHLIIVPYTIKHDNIPEYLEEKLKLYGF